MTTTLILVIAVLIVILIGVTKAALNERKEKNQYKTQLESKNKTIAYLYNHSEEISAINAEANKLEGKINNAKTDEEIADIINSVINNNNSKL